MELSFEVKESDLLGRVGTLKVGGKSLETPYMFPVIHPVSQAVPAGELAEMGFGGLMTNSYIILSRLKEEALEKGIHRLLGFDGVFMTDSGGYQVLEYGDLEVDHRQVARFQADIGSELAVTLDRPTGHSESLRHARETMEYSLKNALETIEEFGGRKTTWVGPVQGGLFPSLLKKSASSLVDGGFRFLALGSPVQIMENYRFADLAKMIVATRRAIPYAVPLHLFGAGHPLTMPLAVSLGCDTFDSASYILFARSGRYMTERGVRRVEEMRYLPCSCPVCLKTSVKELLEMGPSERTRTIASHNLRLLRKELDVCREAIAEGRLWDLVRERAMAHPGLFGVLPELERAKDLLSDGTPPLKDRGLLLRDEIDIRRPEVSMAVERLGWARRKGSKGALLLAFDYQRSGVPKPKRADAGKGFDVYRLDTVLGPVPIELEFVYPFTQTVKSESLGQLVTLKEGVKRLKEFGYTKVLVGKTPGVGALGKKKVRSRRNRRGASPSPQSSSAPPLSLRRL